MAPNYYITSKVSHTSVSEIFSWNLENSCKEEWKEIPFSQLSS